MGDQQEQFTHAGEENSVLKHLEPLKYIQVYKSIVVREKHILMLYPHVPRTNATFFHLIQIGTRAMKHHQPKSIASEIRCTKMSSDTTCYEYC